MNASAVPDGVDLRTLVSELGLSIADVADLVEGLPAAVVHALLEEMTDSGRALPVDPIATAEAVEMSFLERPHLRYLSDRISKAVADVEAGQDRRLIVQMPPRAGKTTLGSKLTVGWTMGRHPTWPIALTSHDGGLATSWGREIRKWAETGKLGDGVALAKDAGAASSWETTEGGKLLSISIRESFTGRGAKCVTADTRILTDRGHITAADAYDFGITRILAYDHVAERAVWRRVVAAQRSVRGGIVEVVTQAGRVIRCTDDHPIYTSRGYVPAGDLRPGETLVAVPTVDRVPGVLRTLRGGTRRPTQGGTSRTRGLLQALVRPGGRSGHATHPLVPLRAGGEEERNVLLHGVPSASETRASSADLWRVRDDSHRQVISAGVLLPTVRGRRPLEADARFGELAPSRRELVLETVQAHEAADLRAGRRMYRLRRVSVGHLRARREDRHQVSSSRASHRRGRAAQPTTEPRGALRDAPRRAPQVEHDAVAVVRRLRGGAQPVYDFQVEGTRNFFADGVLVHNCLIIDDPHKDFVDAHSKTMRDNVWGWWLSVAQTRLEPPSLVIVTMCLTGETPVLMADGSEKPLRDVRVGDQVATYEDGGLTSSTVRNWKSQGRDRIRTVRMESGREVRGNDRHPFLTVNEDGTETWVRLGSLKAGMKVRSHTEPTAASRFSELPLRTWSTGTDRILEIVDSGEAEVFDVQIDRTENFIANGMTVHNTRWHQDDFVGRLLSKDHEGAPEDWEVIRFPAIAEDEDVLGRAPGEPILSPLIQETPEQALVRWAGVRRSVGEYVWSAMYQQRPSPSKGSIFDMDKLRFWTRDPDKVTPDGRVVLLPEDIALGRWLDSWDTAFKATTTSDFVVGQRWVRRGANRYLIAQRRDRWTFTDTVAQLEAWAKPDDPVGSPYGHLVHQRLVEEAANGPAIISTLKDKVSGLKPIKATIGKEARARAITPEIESGNVLLPLPSEAGYSWVTELVSEMRNFPNDAHDDQVDALTQALTELRDNGKGAVTPPEGRIDRHLARAASSGRSRIVRSNGR